MKPRLASLVLAAASCLAACSGSIDSASVSREALLRFFPADTSGVVFADFGALREHVFVSDFVEETAGVRTPEELDEFEAATGFDFRTDVRQVMGGSPGNGRALIVVDAAFDNERIVQYLTGEGMRVGEHGGVQLFQPDPAESALIAFVGDVALIGTESEVRAAIDRAGGDLPSALDNLDLLADIREVEEGYQIWATGRLDNDLIPEGVGGSGPMELLASLERGTYQMRIDDTIAARAIGEFATPDQARTAASLLEGLRGIALIQDTLEEELAELLSGILIASNDTRVEVQLQIETAVLERLAESGALSR